MQAISVTKKGIQISLILLIMGAALMSFGQEADKEAIKRVVMQETESYLGVDQNAWFETWLHVPYAYWSFSNKEGTQFVDGWDKIQTTFEEYFKTQKPSRSKVTYIWQEIRVYGNGAYVRFRERADDNHTIEVTNQIRVLEKKEGKWKMVCMSAVVELP